MILTLTMNPAIDHNVAVDRLAFEDRGYICSTQDSAGGRGINASSVIHSFGGQTLAICPAGGRGGQKLTRFLDAVEFPYEVVPIAGEIRTNLNLTDRTGLTIKLNERGPVLNEEEVAAVERAVKAHLPFASWLMICGSLPQNVGGELYGSLVRLGKSAGVNVLLDADDEELREGLEAGPFVVTPNQREAERLLNTVLITRTHFVAAAERIRQMGPANVVLSIGSRGAVLATVAGVWEVEPPRVDAVSPVGAGDALAAAFTWAMQNGHDPLEAVRWGVAAGTASSMKPGLSFAGREETEDVLSRVAVRRVSSL
ncbi:MAG: 1-phosphofructokinase family hexose kinase [Bryobacterales bacterium]|nr:1-phosphofructokinase family hexose kinase [Bryobacterales bacterium]